ncbi:MAG: DUF2442 domain-containing protein [Alphaproteobacteria bacterium]|nr:DUF2442 domain-containing protein [Alphaproteobacteria bacterium]
MTGVQNCLDRVADVRISALTVLLRDGRKIGAPLDWFPRLKAAPMEARAAWEPAAAGHGIHWPLIDEDLSIDGLLKGASAA